MFYKLTTMDQLDTIRFRKHPGGLRAIIKTFRILLQLGMLVFSIFLLCSLYQLFTGEVSVAVISRKPVPGDLPYGITAVKNIGRYTFDNPNWIEWLFFSHGARFQDVFSYAITLLSMWFTFKIFKELDLNNPFSIGIAKNVRILGLIFIAGFGYNFLRSMYLVAVIRSLTSREFTPYSISGSYGGLISGIILLIIAAVYKRACELQQYRDLTI